DPASFRIDLEPGATFVGEYTLSNHGRVAGHYRRITPAAAPGLLLGMLGTEIPRIGAQESIKVPFRLTRLPVDSTTTVQNSTPSPVMVAFADVAGPRTGGPRAEAQAGGGGGGGGAGGFDPCKGLPAASYNAIRYVCAAGVVTQQTVRVEMAAVPPLGLGICSDECTLCDCAVFFPKARGLCKCAQALITGDPHAACTCMGAGFGSGAQAACECGQGIAAGDPSVACTCIGGLMGGDAGNMCGCLAGGDPCACIKTALGDKQGGQACSCLGLGGESNVQRTLAGLQLLDWGGGAGGGGGGAGGAAGRGAGMAASGPRRLRD